MWIGRIPNPDEELGPQKRSLKLNNLAPIGLLETLGNTCNPCVTLELKPDFGGFVEENHLK